MPLGSAGTTAHFVEIKTELSKAVFLMSSYLDHRLVVVRSRVEADILGQDPVPIVRIHMSNWTGLPEMSVLCVNLFRVVAVDKVALIDVPISEPQLQP
jgi:hypothetical protein